MGLVVRIPDREDAELVAAALTRDATRPDVPADEARRLLAFAADVEAGLAALDRERREPSP